MKRFFAGIILVLIASQGTGCSRSRNYAVSDPISVSGSTIQVRSDSRFEEELKVVPVRLAPGGERVLRAVGQMVAVANPAGSLEGAKISWATLDPSYLRQLGIHLSDNAPPGMAYGVTTVNSSNREQIHPNERVDIFRYGLKQGGTVGFVVAVKNSDNELAEPDEYTVIFAIRQGQEWYPGTNCEVEFPLIRRAAIALSPLSMLHEGIHDFVLKQVGPNQYTPVRINVLNETLDEVYALGPLSPGEQIVQRGAILLKPIVHQVEASHAR